MTLFNLSGKTAFVTGASGGLGQAMAIGLANWCQCYCSILFRKRTNR